MHYISDHCLHCGGTAFRSTQSHLTYCLVCGVLFKRPPPTQLTLNLTTRIPPEWKNTVARPVPPDDAFSAPNYESRKP